MLAKILFLLASVAPFLVLLQGSWASEKAFNIFRYPPNNLDRKYGRVSEHERRELANATRAMFYFGYENYMKHAYPKDELNPIYCSGRGPDWENP